MKILLRILGILLAVIVLISAYFALNWYVQFKVVPEKEFKSYEGENVDYPFVDGSFYLPPSLDLDFTTLSEAQTEAKANESAYRRIISLNGTWEIEEGSLSQMPGTFTHTTQVPGFADMSHPEFSGVGNVKTLIGLGSASPAGFLSLLKFRDKNREAFWYRKEIILEEELPAVSFLKIHKAKYGSEVWLNGVRLGENNRHFLSGTYDVSGILKGRGADNELVVRVGTSVTYKANNRNIYGDVLEKSRQLPGIYDNVELILSGHTHIVKVQVVPQLKEKSLRVLSWVKNRSAEEIETRLSLSVKDTLERLVGNAIESETFHVAPGQTVLVESELSIEDFRPWSPESPVLYSLSTRTSDDHLETTFGMRDFHFDSETKQPILNGQPYYLRGTSVPIYRFAEDPMRGNKLWNEVWIRELFRQFKEMHWNTIRFHVGPAPSLWYKIADEEGMIIQDEYAIWTFNMFRSGVRLDTLVSEYVHWMEERWNHASLLIWDAQNESVQSKEPRTGWALNMVRGLDQSGRPWDNGWGDPQRESDPVELHPYLYSGSMFNFLGKDLKPLPAIDTFAHTQPDSILLGQGSHPALVNEYAWLWVRRDGEPTTLTEQGYKTYFPDFTASDRQEYYAYHCALQTEYYRALRVAGVMQFAGLNSNYEGCKTTDIFIDIENLIIEPFIGKYVRDAFSPEGICLWYWRDRAKAGSKESVPIVLINDLQVSQMLTVKISFIKDKEVISSTTLSPTQVQASGKSIIETTIQFPGAPGDYELIAEIRDQYSNPVSSIRKIEVR